MKPPVVVNLRHSQYDVFIGRPGKWGNIFHRGTREENIRRYRKWILRQPQLLHNLRELEGQRLGCYCKPLACHGDVLVELFMLEYSR